MQQGRPAHAPKAASPCTEGCNPIHQSLHPPAYQSLRACALQVRSSSLFEDAFLQPFAGIYRTVMMPNTSPSLDERVDELGWAVRMVYASTFSQQARQCPQGATSTPPCYNPLRQPPCDTRPHSGTTIPLQARQYLESTNNRMEEEKMAVIMQAHAIHAHAHAHVSCSRCPAPRAARVPRGTLSGLTGSPPRIARCGRTRLPSPPGRGLGHRVCATRDLVERHLAGRCHLLPQVAHVLHAARTVELDQQDAVCRRQLAQMVGPLLVGAIGLAFFYSGGSRSI